MIRLIAAAILLGFSLTPGFGQIVTVNPMPPPCAGPHCVVQQRGARVEHHGGPSAQKAACPSGTVYDSRKGTCHVLPN